MVYALLLIALFSLVGLLIGLWRPNLQRHLLGRSLSRRQYIFTLVGLFTISISSILIYILVTLSLPTLSSQMERVGQLFESLSKGVVAPPTRTDSFVPEASVDSNNSRVSTLYEVVRVIDGDTIAVAVEGSPRTVRYIGINTPETVHPARPVECFGREAADKNKDLVAGKFVRLVKDVSDTDKYGRWLRYVYVDEVLVNEVLVREGYANAATYPPNVLFNDLFQEAETEARLNQRGLWGSACADSVPTTKASPPQVQSDQIRSCSIKGNISAQGEKIYHVVGCEYYDQTVIDESRGERWFCSEAEAQVAGWRKALNC